MKITYTFPENFQIEQLRSVTCAGGIPGKRVINNIVHDVVEFDTKINGQQVVAKLDGKPDLQQKVTEYHAAIAAEKQEIKNKLEEAVPGYHATRELANKVSNDDYRYAAEFEQMMDDEQNDGAKPPKPVNESNREKLAQMMIDYPRAALYIKAENQLNSTHWADNTGKGAAGRKSMLILASGGSIEDAQKALAERRDFID